MELLSFLMAAVVLAVTPGPGMAYVVARTAAGGRSEGLASCLGTALGGLVHVLAAALGVSMLIAQSALAFGVLKWVGVAYLVYLGVGMLRRTSPVQDASDVPVQGVRKALLQGVCVEALNVKTAMFFLAFLPQFVQLHQPVLPQLVLMGCICVALNTLVDVLCVLLAQRVLERAAQAGHQHRQHVRWIQRMAAGVMLGLATWLALARRQSL